MGSGTSRSRSWVVPAPGPPDGRVVLVGDPQAHAGLERARVVGEVGCQAHVVDRPEQAQVCLVGGCGGDAREHADLDDRHALGGTAVGVHCADRELARGALGWSAGGEGERRAVGAVGRRAGLVGRHERGLHRARALRAGVGVDGDRLPVGENAARQRGRLLPSEFMMLMPPPESLKTIFVPSGDQAGAVATSSKTRDRCAPAAFTIQIPRLDAWWGVRLKAIVCPIRRPIGVTTPERDDAPQARAVRPDRVQSRVCCGAQSPIGHLFG